MLVDLPRGGSHRATRICIDARWQGERQYSSYYNQGVLQCVREHFEKRSRTTTDE